MSETNMMQSDPNTEIDMIPIPDIKLEPQFSPEPELFPETELIPIQVDEMASPHYSLRWNNHQSHLLTAFDSLLQNETLVDVTLVCEETSFKAHKVVLSACSPYFQRIFSETPCKHPVIVLKDLRGWEVQAIVDFMYRGEISVGQEQLSSLIKAAESLQVRGLAHTERIPMCPGDKESHGQQGVAQCFSPAPGVGLFPPPQPPMSTNMSPHFEPPLRLPQLPHMPHISFTDVDRHCSSPLPRRKQARPRRRSGDTCGAQDLTKCPTSPMESETAENLSLKKSGNSINNNNNNINSNNNNTNNNNNNNSNNNNNNSSSNSNNNALPLNRPSSTPTPPHLNPMKMESEDSDAADSSQTQPVELTTNSSVADHRGDYSTNSSEPISSLPPPPHETTLENSLPHLASISALSLTPPHMFSLDSHLGFFPGMESCRNSLLNELPEPRNENHHISVKKKRSAKYDVVTTVGRPKGQHSAPRGGPPRSWTNAELTEALQHVWNKKMTTSQASRIFGIPYNSLLMYVRGKYGKSLKLEQLKKECFGDLGGPLDLLGLGSLASNNNNPASKHHKGPEPDLMLGPPGFNPGPYSGNFYPDFGASFPVPVGMVHLLPQSEKNREPHGPLDYVKEELLSQRNDMNPLEYTKEEVNIRNSPMALDFAKDDSNIHNSSVREDDDEDGRKSPRHHDDNQHSSQHQNGQD